MGVAEKVVIHVMHTCVFGTVDGIRISERDMLYHVTCSMSSRVLSN